MNDPADGSTSSRKASRKIWDKYPDAGPTPAATAYIGSPFVVNRRYAGQADSDWGVLSAPYGFPLPCGNCTGRRGRGSAVKATVGGHIVIRSTLDGGEAASDSAARAEWPPLLGWTMAPWRADEIALLDNDVQKIRDHPTSDPVQATAWLSASRGELRKLRAGLVETTAKARALAFADANDGWTVAASTVPSSRAQIPNSRSNQRSRF